MEKTCSLKENYRFRALYAKGRNTAGRYVAVYMLKNRLKTCNRLGITTSTKLGCAVERNRMRRRLKEAYRLQESSIRSGMDIVLVARRGCLHADFSDLRRELADCFGRLGMLE